MKKLYKSLAVILAAALLLGMLLPASAARDVINVVEITSTVTSNTTLYAGEIFSDGESVMRYLYTDDVTISQTVLEAIRKAFAGSASYDFSDLVPSGDGLSGNGFAVCSLDEYSAAMNADWANAQNAAEQCYPDSSVTGSSSSDLFETDEGFAAACVADWGQDNMYFYDDDNRPFDICGPLGILTVSSTDNVTYTVEDGELIAYRDRHISYTCESVTVIYTRAELGSGEPASGKIYKAVLEFQQGGTRTEKVSEETDIAAYIAEKKSAFEAATAGGGSSDIIVEQNGYEAFFTENTYAEIYMFEYVGTICKLSDDAIVIGDIDDFDNLYVVSGTVTREQHYRVYYELVTVTKEESEPDWTPGDINGDGFADNKDVVTLFRHLTGYPDKVITAALDCNGDGLSDNKDVTVLFRYVSTNFRSFISDKPYKEA